MHEVTLRIKTVFESDGKSDTIELTTVANYDFEEGIHILEYEESEVSGLEGSRTTIKVLNKECIAVFRSGQVSTKVMYKLGEEVHSKYNTPYGPIDMIVNTQKIKLDVEDDVFKNLELLYDMELKGLTNSQNNLSIEII